MMTTFNFISRDYEIERFLRQAGCESPLACDLNCAPPLRVRVAQGHFIFWEGGIHDVETKKSVSAGVPATDGRAVPIGPQPGKLSREFEPMAQMYKTIRPQSEDTSFSSSVFAKLGPTLFS